MALTSRKYARHIDKNYFFDFAICFGIILLFCLSSRVFHRVLLSDGGSSSVFIIIWLIVYLLSLFYIFSSKVSNAILFKTYPLLLFIFFCLFSSLWSLSFKETIQDSITLFGCLLFSIAVWRYLGNERVLDIINLFLQIIVFTSLISIILFPGYAADLNRLDNSWIGVFAHKNYFGRLSALLFLFSIFYKFKIRNIFFIFISIICVLLSTSVGALFLIMSVSVVLFYFRLYEKVRSDQRWYVTISAAFASLMVLLLLQQYYTEFLNAFGKDATLTGRTVLWSIAEKFALESPLFGYGYSAFWSKGSFTAEQFLSQSSWEAPHAHNGYIDLILDVGIVGLIVFIVPLVLIFKGSIKLLLNKKVSIPLAILLYLVIANFAEKIITVGNDFHWIIFCLIYLIVMNPDLDNEKKYER